MVVCKIVRIRNSTAGKFYIEPAGDLFHTPQIGGEPCGDKPFEVPPGADLATEGLVVPWAAVTRSGLAISHEASAERVRCVVGPADSDCWDIDWLRLHDASWEPLLQERWLALGHRHLLGGVEVLELELSLRSPRRSGGVDSRGCASTGPAACVAECVHFDRAIDNAPPNTVLLNVYDLASAATVPNAMLCNMFLKGFGAFHAAVEVYGQEWSFYQRQQPHACGICRSRHVRQHPVHVFRQSINMGATKLSKQEVWDMIVSRLAREWPSFRYDVVRCNCITFCDELLRLLGAEPVPRWVRGLQDAGTAVLSAPQSLSALLRGSVSGGFGASVADAGGAGELEHERRAKEQEYYEEVKLGAGQGHPEPAPGEGAVAGSSAGLCGAFAKDVAKDVSGSQLYHCLCRAIRRALGSASALPARLRARLAAVLRPP